MPCQMKSIFTFFDYSNYWIKAINYNKIIDKEGLLYLYKNDNLLSKSYITHKKDTIINMEITNAKSFKIMVDKGMNQDWGDWFYLENFQLN